jgi:hypothetical protein
MYLAFKEKLNSLRNDEFERHKFMNRLQVGFVAVFWVGLSVALLYYGHQKELREKAAYKQPTIPEISQPSQTQVVTPPAKSKGRPHGF